ncbi:MAG: CBS domain-containing protein, partial [Nitrospirae bacterium]|nr:CBS domain-containing protein [Nitrospirota bacterium]
MSREEFSLLNELMKSLAERVINNVRIKIGKGVMEGVGDVAHLAHHIMDMEDTDAVILLIGMADKILIVARSRVPELDVAAVLSDFGGGGHPTAASATIKDMPFEIVEEKLVILLNKHIRPIKLVKDVMTTPVIVIEWTSSIKEAERVMTRYGVNALPVVRDGRYRGVLTREVVEKALFHGLGRNRCEDFATTDAITAPPDKPVAEVEKSMIEQNQRFVTVLEADRIVGAVTRTDMLRSLYDDFLRKSRVSSKESLAGETYTGLGRNIAVNLKEKLPSHLFDFLLMAGEAADELRVGAYLVGGSVRDLLRGEENLDIDIVVEGDGIHFAKKLGKKIGAKVTVHQKFGTAQVIKDDFKLDVATARTEYYESPAALPKVETSSIKKDLYRRDFTINTLAVKLNRKDFGLLIDFFGGQRDLKDR